MNSRNQYLNIYYTVIIVIVIIDRDLEIFTKFLLVRPYPRTVPGLTPLHDVFFLNISLKVRYFKYDFHRIRAHGIYKPRCVRSRAKIEQYFVN